MRVRELKPGMVCQLDGPGPEGLGSCLRAVNVMLAARRYDRLTGLIYVRWELSDGQVEVEEFLEPELEVELATCV